MKAKTKGPDFIDRIADPFSDESHTDESRNPTETIDLNSLFEPDVNVSGSFNLNEVKTTSFGKLLQALPIPALLLDWDGYVCFANRAWEQKAGDDESPVGLSVRDLFIDDASKIEAEEIFDAVCISRKPQAIEANLTLGLNEIWARVHLRSMRIGKDRSILALIEDLTLERRQILQKQKLSEELEQKVQDRTRELSKAISMLKTEIDERKEAESKLDSAVEELRNLIQTANAPIFGIDRHGRITEWNQKAEKITGHKFSEIKGKKLLEEFISSDHVESVSEILDKALNGLETENFEAAFNTRNSGKVMILLNATRRRNSEGKIIGVVGVGQDVTDLIAHQNQLQEMVDIRTHELSRSLEDTAKAKDRIDTILKSVADGLIVTKTDGTVALMNRAAESLLGIDFHDVKDKPISHSIDDIDLRKKIALNMRNPNPNKSFDIPTIDPVKHKQRILRAKNSLIIDNFGQKRGVVTTLRDVTREREVDRLKTEFISTAAHQLRTPLTSILGFSELLHTDETIEEEEKGVFLRYINEQAHKLAKIIDELLDISRIESGRGFKLTVSDMTAPDFVMELAPVLRQTYKDQRFAFTKQGESVGFSGDKGKLEQAIFNIVDNSVKYSNSGEKIHILCETGPDSFSVTVTDEGFGMTQDQIEHVFDKFYRGDASDSAIDGVGLGMTIVKSIVDAHNGAISIKSKLGKGSTVSFTVPLTPKAQSAADCTLR